MWEILKTSLLGLIWKSVLNSIFVLMSRLGLAWNSYLRVENLQWVKTRNMVFLIVDFASKIWFLSCRTKLHLHFSKFNSWIGTVRVVLPNFRNFFQVLSWRILIELSCKTISRVTDLGVHLKLERTFNELLNTKFN